MCGISVLLSDHTEPIQLMNDLIKHRGPDADDFYYGEGFAFGHRRLSILDLSIDGKQPMRHPSTGNIITYNGEIYNYIEIKNELMGRGHHFTTKTDTEVILAAYAEWGEACTKRFNGMWAFALFDKKLNSIFVSRDRFGVKPLYLYQDETKLALSSEIKQLLVFTGPKANISAVTGFLVTGLLDYSIETFFKNIKKLQASYNYVIDIKTRKIISSKFFDIQEQVGVKDSFETDLNRFGELMKSSIKFRLRSDVKVGTCLSGGLDSSTVAALSSDMYQGTGRFQGIFAQSSEIATDESKYANLVANHKNIELNTIKPTYEDFASHVDEVTYTQEEPFVSPSIFMQYFVMKKAKEIGCKVMLDGQGGDETLLGYEKYYSSVLYEKWKKDGSFEFFEALKNARKNNSRLTPVKLLMYFFGMVSWRSRLIAHCYQARMLKTSSFFNNYWYLKTLSRCVMSSPFRLQRFEIFNTNLPSLLRYEDKNSMRHSIEARLPFLDYRLVEHNLNLKSDHKIKEGWSKFILRKFLEGRLPAEVIWRKNKLGFEAPEKSWIKQHETIMKDEIRKSKILESLCDSGLAKVDARAGLIFWRLYNIAVWERIYKVTL